jgi:hypothetical protein
MSNLILFGSGSTSRKRKGLRKPKLKKFPKIPKTSKIEPLIACAKKCEEIRKLNVIKLNDYNRKLKAMKDVKTKISKLKDSIKSYKGNY